MERSAAYLIVIIRSGGEYFAVAPAFPQLRGRAPSARAAYRHLKEKITTHIRHLIDVGEPIPREPVVQTRTLRLDLWYLRDQEDLR